MNKAGVLLDKFLPGGVPESKAFTDKTRDNRRTIANISSLSFLIYLVTYE